MQCDDDYMPTLLRQALVAAVRLLFASAALGLLAGFYLSGYYVGFRAAWAEAYQSMPCEPVQKPDR